MNDSISHSAKKVLTRAQIRHLKKEMNRAIVVSRAEVAADCARQLLQRSVDMGHRRLSVARARSALALGVVLTAEQVAFCLSAARAIDDTEMIDVLAGAISSSGVPCG